jgi:hypothetical protein
LPAGDFCRRFSLEQIDVLQDKINEARQNVWSRQSQSFFDEAIVDMDGSIAPTFGECKQGMGMSYKGEWGYHPLIVSLANTNEVLFAMNRSGNRPSYEGAHIYIDKSITLLRKAGFKIVLKLDWSFTAPVGRYLVGIMSPNRFGYVLRRYVFTDFSQTEHLDRWDDQDVLFVFGMDARKNLTNLAKSLENTAWERLERPPKYEVKTKPRGKRENVKEQIVIEREYKNLTLEYEDIAEVEYKPTKCEKSYRLVVLRKTISVKRGQELLFPEIRYFFYITNDREQSAAAIVFESNKRCNQENLIENFPDSAVLSGG